MQIRHGVVGVVAIACVLELGSRSAGAVPITFIDTGVDDLNGKSLTLGEGLNTISSWSAGTTFGEFNIDSYQFTVPAGMEVRGRAMSLSRTSATAIGSAAATGAGLTGPISGGTYNGGAIGAGSYNTTAPALNNVLFPWSVHYTLVYDVRPVGSPNTSGSPAPVGLAEPANGDGFAATTLGVGLNTFSGAVANNFSLDPEFPATNDTDPIAYTVPAGLRVVGVKLVLSDLDVGSFGSGVNIGVRANGGGLDLTANANTGYSAFSAADLGPGSRSLSLGVVNSLDADANYTVIFDVRPIPEPTSFALLGGAAAAVATLRRRRRRKPLGCGRGGTM